MAVLTTSIGTRTVWAVDEQTAPARKMRDTSDGESGVCVSTGSAARMPSDPVAARSAAGTVGRRIAHWHEVRRERRQVVALGGLEGEEAVPPAGGAQGAVELSQAVRWHRLA